MPEKVILSDGSELDVPTAEERVAMDAAIKKSAEVEVELQKAKEELDKINSDPAHINFKKIREKEERLRKALKDQGKEVDEDGNVIAKPPEFNREEILTEATNRAKGTLIESVVNEYLSKFEKDTQEVIKLKYQKLSAGEQVDLANVKSFLDKAARIAVPERARTHPGHYTDGAPPMFAKKDSAVSETQKEMANNFGIPISELEKGE
jgi:hypothetical protein